MKECVRARCCVVCSMLPVTRVHACLASPYLALPCLALPRLAAVARVQQLGRRPHGVRPGAELRTEVGEKN